MAETIVNYGTSGDIVMDDERGDRVPWGAGTNFIDVVLDDASIGIAWSGPTGERAMPSLTQGVNVGERIGRSVDVVYLRFRYRLELQSSTTKVSTACSTRIILFIDKQWNNTVGNGTSPMSSDRITSWVEPTLAHRFEMLYDVTHDLRASSGGGNGTTEDYGEDCVSGQFECPLNLRIEYAGTTNNQNETNSNTLRMFNINSTNVLVDMTAECRIHYIG